MSTEELFADEVEAPGPGGGQLLIALIALFVIVLAIVGLVAIGGWVTLVVAVALMLVGVFGVTRYVQTIALTRQPGEQGEHAQGSHAIEDLAVTGDSHTQISRHDIPLGEPERLSAPATSEQSAETDESGR
ncbi:MAG TPA: hypothetical protein VH081_01660 [Solirubrobacteraceae bacterium]|jgi:hypothetical protein|nr:hypothetical protein [Solirubrobacteraceae bacterium]